MARKKIIPTSFKFNKNSSLSSNSQINQFLIFFSLLQEKTDELKLYRPPTADLEELQQREKQDEVFRFLASLDSSYETVRSHILLGPELPSLDDAMARIEGEETRRVVMGSQPSTDQENKVFYSRYQNPRSEMKGAQAIWCEHCKNKGHRRDECRFLHLHLRPKSTKRQGTDRKGERFSRDERRNFSVEVREEKEIGERVNRVEGHSVIKEFAPISSDQIRQMMEQLTVLLSHNEEKGKAFGIILNSSIYSKNDKWILDSGATDHMTGNKNLLFNFRKHNTK
jgi:hypothetical protein